MARVIKKGEKYVYVEQEDWCNQAGGHWITEGGQHICVEVSDYSKVPRKIRGQVKGLAGGFRLKEPVTIAGSKMPAKKDIDEDLASFRSQARDDLEKDLERLQELNKDGYAAQFDRMAPEQTEKQGDWISRKINDTRFDLSQGLDNPEDREKAFDWQRDALAYQQFQRKTIVDDEFEKLKKKFAGK